MHCLQGRTAVAHQKRLKWLSAGNGGHTMKTCKHTHCIANFDGECVVDKCQGEIVAIDLPVISHDQAARHYNMAAEFFKEDAE